MTISFSETKSVAMGGRELL